MDLPFSTASDHAVCMTLGRYIATILTSSMLKDPRAPLAQVFEKKNCNCSLCIKCSFTRLGREHWQELVYFAYRWAT